MDIIQSCNMIADLFDDGSVWTRQELAILTDMPDRAIRNMIREARRQGVPIMALPNGGYKLAQTNEEKQKLLHMYRGRAMDELCTYRALSKTMQLDGQISVEDMLEGADVVEQIKNDLEGRKNASS